MTKRNLVEFIVGPILRRRAPAAPPQIEASPGDEPVARVAGDPDAMCRVLEQLRELEDALHDRLFELGLIEYAHPLQPRELAKPIPADLDDRRSRRAAALLVMLREQVLWLEADFEIADAQEFEASRRTPEGER